LFNKLETTDPAQMREEFLDTCAREMKSISALERYETIAEMRAHLVALAAAHEELGLTPTDAMATAIAGFGDARLIGKKIQQESGKIEVSWLPLISAIGSGAIISATLMTVLDQIIVATGLVSYPSTGMPVVGAVTGLLIGLSLFVRRRTAAQAALWAGMLVPAAFLLLVFLLNRSFVSLSFFSIRFVYFSSAGALSAAATAKFIALTDRTQDSIPSRV